MRFSEAIKLFKNHAEAEQKSEATIRGYFGELMLFCLYLRNPLITQIAPEHIDVYLKEKKELGWKHNSLVVPAMAIRKLFEYWGRKGYPVLDWRILPIIHKEGVLPKVASQEAVGKLLDQCEGGTLYNVRNRAIILFLVDTGVRNGELCSLSLEALSKTEKVEGEGGVQYSCIVKTEKRKGARNHRRIFWYEEANEALNRWLLIRAEYVRMFKPEHPESVFVSVMQSHGKYGCKMTPHTVGDMLKKLSAQAGIPTVNAHSLRHLFGNTAADQGLNNSNISDLMGHANLESSFVYTHLRGNQLGEAHRRLRAKKD